MSLIRIDKFLTEMNQGTRSQIKEAARKGRILVNGSVEKKSDRKIDPDHDTVTLDGQEIVYAAYEYYMLNKPADVVSATRDGLHRTVVDLITDKKRNDLFPVGRLDIDTEGLLLITNDGDLAHRLLSPAKHVDKTYFAKVEGTLLADTVQMFQEGLVLPDQTKLLPAKLELLKPETPGICPVRLTIREGKFHQVKRMFEAVGCRVVYLQRVSMGPLKLDDTLKTGAFRALSGEEIQLIKESVSC